MHEAGDDPGPAGLMAGTQAGPVVAVEVLVEQDEVAPVRVFLELLRAAIELTGFYLTDENRYVIGLSCGRNPFRWFWDMKLYEVVKELLMNDGMMRFSTQTVAGEADSRRRL
jgi:hypothetical protein